MKLTHCLITKATRFSTPLNSLCKIGIGLNQSIPWRLVSRNKTKLRDLVLRSGRADEVYDKKSTELNQEESAVSRNVWDYKPWWCKPYTIIATGVVGVGFVYNLTNGSLIFSGIVAVLVSLWWYIFLIIYPSQFELYLLEQEDRYDESENQM